MNPELWIRHLDQLMTKISIMNKQKFKIKVKIIDHMSILKYFIGMNLENKQNNLFKI